MPRTARVLALAAAVTVLVVALPAESHAVDRPHVDTTPTNPEQLPVVRNVLVDTNTECGPPASAPVPDGEDIVVVLPPITFTVGQIPAAWWKRPPYGDASWQLRLRGFSWVHALAQRASLDGQRQSLNSLVEQVLAFHRQNPDPGTSQYGWDEGTALRRLGAENCLYSLTGDSRLIPVMQADVAVQYGPRFYGPPRWPVHNHGVMADLAVVHAADLLGRKDWVTRSMNRLVADAPLAWTTKGTTHEQSSTYQVFNVRLWGEVADVLQAHTIATATVQRVRDLVARATRVAAWLTEPDGRLVMIGDSLGEAGFPRPTWTATTFRDDVAGFVVGRWSWSDPLTSYYTIRYGPKRWTHGQQDRGGVTWSAYGRRVLVGPGKAPYDPAGAYAAWATGPSSHNVATADKRALNTNVAVSRTAGTVRSSWHSWTTFDQLYGIRHTRQTSIVRPTRILTVKDTYAGKAVFHQFWHLDPSWVLRTRSADGRRLTFSSGVRTLVVDTTGLTAVLRGLIRPVAGWNFGGGRRVSAVQIQVRGVGTATTTFKVT